MKGREVTVPSAVEVLAQRLQELWHNPQEWESFDSDARFVLDALSAAGYVIVPRDILAGLVDCHPPRLSSTSPECGFVAEAKRLLASTE
jgi:hypothetical protein